MIKLVKDFLIAFAILTVGMISVVDARPGHGGGGANISHPILQSVAINVANLTRAGKSGSRLNSTDVAQPSVPVVIQSGVDLITGGTTPATWTVIFTGGRSATDFTLPSANTPEGTAAITPVPSSSGQGNLSGDYTFNVTAKDASGQSSNTVQLTIHIVNPTGGGCVSFGDQDSTSGLFPASFGNVTGQCLLFSTGFNKVHSRLGLGFPNFANEVIITDADLTKHSAISNIFFTGSNMTIQDLWLSGDLGSAGSPLCIVCSTNGSNFKWKRIHAYYGPTLMGTTGVNTTYNSGGCTSGCEIDDSQFHWVWTGSAWNSGIVMNRVIFRYYLNNCNFAGSVSSAHLTDVTCMSPAILGSFHGDTMQFADSSAANNVSLSRFISVGADTTTGFQGPWFGGSMLNLAGYQSSGAGSSSPGNTITLTTGHWTSSAANGTQIYSPGVTGFNSSDNIVIASGAVINGTTATVSGAAQSVGSPGSPIPIWSFGFQNMQANGMIYVGNSPHGTLSQGEQGASFIHNADYVMQRTTGQTDNGPPSLITQFCNVPQIHGGTNDYASMYVEGTYFGQQVGGGFCAGPPSNTTLNASVFRAGCSAPYNCPNADASFKYGNPQLNFEAISNAAWAAMDDATVIGTYAHYLMPKSGGPLDAGGGLWLGAVKDDGLGDCVWNDGTNTIIPQCTP